MVALEIVDDKLRVRGVFADNPDSVFKQIKAHYEYVGGYGHLLLMGQAGFLDHRETVNGINRFGVTSTRACVNSHKAEECVGCELRDSGVCE